MSASLVLRGLTWDHPRGHLPLVATAEQFAQLHPGVRIIWEKRSLQAFEDAPVETLGDQYDFVVLDHPCIGRVARSGALLPLDEHLDRTFLEDQRAASVGASHESYRWAGRQWALAIDAAAPVACWREDLLAAHGLARPESWEDVLELGRRGHVEVPGAAVHTLMNFFMLCIAAGERPFATEGCVVRLDVAREALHRLREVMARCEPACWSRNPIHSQDLLASPANRERCYCPFAYGYSNYAREDQVAHRLSYGEPPRLGGKDLITVLGGAGLAVYAARPGRDLALAYATYVASPEVQRTLYTRSGGQPGHRSAWTDEANNRLTHDFFAASLPVVDRAFVRPRFEGYFAFQAAAAPLIQQAARGQLDDRTTLSRLNALFQTHLPPNRASA